ncbi:MAG: VOC family protein [Chloroflexi bacterium]|nr:VOC family protein [Chloroflexota bacterium]
MTKQGEFSHIEFPADDLERAKRFYANVFGWQLREAQGFENYVLADTGPGDLGTGIGLRGQTAPASVRNYLAVDNIDASIAKVTEYGGTVVTPTTDIGFGWYAAVTDSEGNEIGLYRPKPQA